MGRLVDRFLVFFGFVVLVAASSSQASVIDCHIQGDLGVISLHGSIVSGDSRQIENCLQRLSAPSEEARKQMQGTGFELVSQRPSSIWLRISSPGGSVAEAMSVGRIVRRERMWVFVPESAKCFSSCIYILAAGVVKRPFGDVGIHRPYFVTAPNQSFDSALKAVLQQSREYFQEMNVPTSLADEMFSIAPSDIKMLGDLPLSRFRLNQTDMAYEEENAMRRAKDLGISRQELMAREKLYDRLMRECVGREGGGGGGSSATTLVVRCGSEAAARAGLTPK